MAKLPNTKLKTYLNHLYDLDYKEHPVPVEQFLCDPEYLGKLTDNGNSIYPCWREKLPQIMQTDKQWQIVLTGAIGIGKTRAAIWGLLYVMYRVLCVDGSCSVYDCEAKKWIKLASAYKNGLSHTLSVDENGNVGSHKVDQIIKSGKKEVYEVVIKYEDHLYKRPNTKTSTDGKCKKIRTTLDHKFWTEDGWKPLKDILIEEKVLVFGNDLHVSKEEKHTHISEASKQVWKTRTQEERLAICSPGLQALQTEEIKNKATQQKQTIGFSKKMSNLQKQIWSVLSEEEKHQKIKHLYTPEIGEKISKSLKKYWATLSEEDRAKRVENWWESLDWESWRERMKLRVWENEACRKKLSSSTKILWENKTEKEKEASVARLHTLKARKLAVKNWKQWRSSLTQEEKNKITEKQLHSKQNSGDFEERLWGYGKRTLANDGHVCDSKFEASVDNWLTQHDIPHNIHNIINNNGRPRSIDFYACGWHIEVDGLNRSDEYFEDRLTGLPYVVIRSRKEIEEKLGFLCKNTNSNFSKTLFGTVKSIKFAGKKETYDVVMDEGAPKNFICNGTVVHNCLRDPWKYFNKSGGGKMAIVFFNLTKGLGYSKGYQLFQSHLVGSPWFSKRGMRSGSEKNPQLDFPLFVYKIGSPLAQGFGTQGEDVIAAIMDEMDSPTESDAQRVKVLKAYESTIRRFETRFVYDGESIGRCFLVASKQDTFSFLNTFVISKKTDPSVAVIDVPFWESQDSTQFCGEKFFVMIGDGYIESKIIQSNEELLEVQANGYECIGIPIEYRLKFEDDMVGSLRDIAGRASMGQRKSKLFTSEMVLNNAYDLEKLEPVRKPTIYLTKDDFNINLIEFLDLSRIRVPRNVPRFLHEDIAYSGNGDSLGLAMSCVSGWAKINIERGDGIFKTIKAPVVETDFIMRLRGKPGEQIPLNVVRKFVLDLRDRAGFNIFKFTADLAMLSIETQQMLERSGISCDTLSMDKHPEFYRNFRDLVKEGRWVCHKNDILHYELVNLEDDHEKNKIDHPDKVAQVLIQADGTTLDRVLSGSKDTADAAAGSVTSAIEHCEIPPDIEVMHSLMKTALGKPKGAGQEEYVNEEWWADVAANKHDKIEEIVTGTMSKTERTLFQEILQKAQGK